MPARFLIDHAFIGAVTERIKTAGNFYSIGLNTIYFHYGNCYNERPDPNASIVQRIEPLASNQQTATSSPDGAIISSSVLTFSIISKGELGTVLVFMHKLLPSFFVTIHRIRDELQQIDNLAIFRPSRSFQ